MTARPAPATIGGTTHPIVRSDMMVTCVCGARVPVTLQGGGRFSMKLGTDYDRRCAEMQKVLKEKGSVEYSEFSCTALNRAVQTELARLGY